MCGVQLLWNVIDLKSLMGVGKNRLYNNVGFVEFEEFVEFKKFEEGSHLFFRHNRVL